MLEDSGVSNDQGNDITTLDIAAALLKDDGRTDQHSGRARVDTRKH